MNAYEDQAWLADRRDLPADDFGFSDVDEFLTQTLNSLQDLDIPVGDPQQQQHREVQYANQTYMPEVRGHKKQPSGTAIFGFVQHNKNLSIPGVGLNHGKKQSIAGQVVAPQEIFSEEHNQQMKQEPILFQMPQDFNMAHVMYQTEYNKAQVPSYAHQLYPPQPPPQMQHQQPVPVRQPQDNDDYIVTKQTPYGYKFPPDHGHPMGHMPPPPPPPPQFHQPHPHQMYHPGPMGPPPPPQMQPGQPQPSPQKTVQVPVEYLQKLTKMIKDTKGVDMESFLGYEFDKLQQGQQPELQPPSSPHRAPSEISPVMKAYQSSNSSGSAPHSREPSPELLEPNTKLVNVNSSPLRIINQVPKGAPSPTKPRQFIQSKPMGLGIMKESETEPEKFKECPKTPSPTLRSQATFSSPTKGGPLSWTPVVISQEDGAGPAIKKKVYDKVSTLPPGEIDQYVIGPRADKTFVCNFNGCGKLFTRRYNVRSHVQTHLSDRPFNCPIPGCKKAFVRHHDLTRHKKIHQEFAFQCECGKKFSRHDALFRHRERNICQGGLDPEEVARLELRPVQTSIQKKRSKDRPSIRIANDTVAKRLEFDLMSCMKKKNVKSHSTPASPQGRKVSGASTVDEEEDEEEEEEEDDGEDDPVFREDNEENQEDNVFLSKEATPIGDLGLMQEFTNGHLEISDDEENVFLNDLNFEQFDNIDHSHEEAHV